MEENEKSKWVIERYQEDERTMVLIFAQWCLNHKVDPVALYQEAYPHQKPNPLLAEVLEETISETDAEDISLDIVLYVLQMFGNDDLAFVVQETADRLEKDKKSES